MAKPALGLIFRQRLVKLPQSNTVSSVTVPIVKSKERRTRRQHRIPEYLTDYQCYLPGRRATSIQASGKSQISATEATDLHVVLRQF